MLVVLVVLKSGSRVAEYSPEERGRLQGEHMANIMRLASERKLCLAGPFGPEKPDPTWRGIFVFDVPTLSNARALTDTDPAVKAGVLAMELRPMRSTSGLRTFLARELQAIEEARREGRELKMEDTIRGYVLVLAKDAERAETLLERHVGRARILLRAHIGDASEGLFVLDQPDVASAKSALLAAGSAADELVLHAWYASKGLVTLAGVPGAR